jgi:hypothetical protein
MGRRFTEYLVMIDPNIPDRNPYLNEPLRDRPADPKCGECRGRGFVYDSEWARTCQCRYSARKK